MSPHSCFLFALLYLSDVAELKVLDLIDWNRRTWDHDIVNETLIPMAAEIVLRMRLFDVNTTDELLWHYTKDGVFSVKSAYLMMMESNIREHETSSSDALSDEEIVEQNLACASSSEDTGVSLACLSEHSPCAYQSLKEKGGSR